MTRTAPRSHSAVGEMTLGFEALEPSADSGLILTAYVAEPNPPHAERLQLLAS